MQLQTAAIRIISKISFKNISVYVLKHLLNITSRFLLRNFVLVISFQGFLVLYLLPVYDQVGRNV